MSMVLLKTTKIITKAVMMKPFVLCRYQFEVCNWRTAPRKKNHANGSFIWDANYASAVFLSMGIWNVFFSSGWFATTASLNSVRETADSWHIWYTLSLKFAHSHLAFSCHSASSGVFSRFASISRVFTIPWRRGGLFSASGDEGVFKLSGIRKYYWLN